MGNSMPIRDLDMYATPAPAAVTPASRPQGVIPVGETPALSHWFCLPCEGRALPLCQLPSKCFLVFADVPPVLPLLHPLPPLQACLLKLSHPPTAAGIGAPVAANRGASGIDGVLSTAAGFADGLGRGTTLVVGDLSFLHDINGLNLLRSGEQGSGRGGEVLSVSLQAAGLSLDP